MSNRSGNDHHDEDMDGLMEHENMSVENMSIASASASEVAHQSRVRVIRVRRKMRFLTAMAAIGGFLFGYDTGVISGAMLPLHRTFHLTAWQEEVVVSSTVLSAFVASLCGGSLNRAFGRRMSILFAAAVFTVGSLVLAVAWGYPSLVVGRIIGEFHSTARASVQLMVFI